MARKLASPDLLAVLKKGFFQCRYIGISSIQGTGSVNRRRGDNIILRSRRKVSVPALEQARKEILTTMNSREYVAKTTLKRHTKCLIFFTRKYLVKFLIYSVVSFDLQGYSPCCGTVSIKFSNTLHI